MNKTVAIILLALLSPASAEESIDKSIDAFFDRFHTGSYLSEARADLDNTMLGKAAGHPAVPSSRIVPSSPTRATPSVYRVPSPSLLQRPRLPVPNVAVRAVTPGSQRQAVPVKAPNPRGSGVSERESTQQHVEEEPPAETEASLAEILGQPRKEAGNTKKLAEILEARAKANREAAAATPPYDIKVYVKGDMANYPHDFKNFAEHKLEDALENYKDHIQAVDLRMDTEGHKPMLFRFEVTVKSELQGATIVSKSKHAHPTFLEAMDDMHDTVKRNMRREKEKRIDKKRSGKVQEEKELLQSLDPSDVIAEADDEEYDFEMKRTRQEP
jgi:ribosomal subunit interface protein